MCIRDSSTYELHNVAVGGKLVNGTADATTADVESSYSGMAGESFVFMHYRPDAIFCQQRKSVENVSRKPVSYTHLSENEL